ncbi:CHAT domain-containing protein [Dactylosporangium sp. CS-047395]|uniref:CHAT domain-containing protein n=1 Tax=Dactylosporangium sp. CS-047395 TaxID=3239936 RepID=UPI003D92E14D
MTVIAEVEARTRAGRPGVEIKFTFPSGRSISLPTNEQQLSAARRTAGRDLQRAMQTVVRRRPSLRQAETALRILFHKGVQLTEMLADLGYERVQSLQDEFRAAWPTWEETADWDVDAPIPVVEFKSRDAALPLELLPLFDFGPLPAIHVDDDLRRVAARFLGFSAVVRRVTSAPVPGNHILRTDPRLPVQFLRHRPWFGGKRDPGLLGALDGAVALEGPWPQAESESAFRAAIVDALHDGRGLDGAAAGDPPVQVHHFACHCDTTAEDDDDYTLRLTTSNRRNRTITLGELRRQYSGRLYGNGSGAPARAVVFLNACASSRTDPDTAMSFPRWFLSHRHRAVIGTLSVVPDAVAGTFADALYGRLLQGERPLGEAMVQARRDMLRDTRNPLGLVYVQHGDTELIADRKRPEIYRRSGGATQ